jgi:hypothetical protein
MNDDNIPRSVRPVYIVIGQLVSVRLDIILYGITQWIFDTLVRTFFQLYMSVSIEFLFRQKRVRTKYYSYVYTIPITYTLFCYVIFHETEYYIIL